MPVEAARYLASRIPTARVVEIPGAGHLAFGTSTASLIANEIERFTTEVWEAGGWDDAEPERVLATVLFTDIVGSTARAGGARRPRLARAARASTTPSSAGS